MRNKYIRNRRQNLRQTCLLKTSVLYRCANLPNSEKREGRGGEQTKDKKALPHEWSPTDLPLQTEPVARGVRGGWFLKGKTDSVHVQLVRGPGGINGGEILSEGPCAIWLFNVVSKVPELYIRHNQPIRKQGQLEQGIRYRTSGLLLTQGQWKCLI